MSFRFSPSWACLQEVSQKWAGPLHCFFQREGYYFVSSHYTRGWQGYMGSAIAFPTDAWMADEVEVVRLADTKPWPRPLKQTNLLDRVVNFVVEGISFLGGGSKKNQKQDHFDLAKNRMNTMILMKLKNAGMVAHTHTRTHTHLPSQKKQST